MGGCRGFFRIVLEFIVSAETGAFAERTAEKLKKLTEEKFVGIVFFLLKNGVKEMLGNGSLYSAIPQRIFSELAMRHICLM